MGLVRSRADQAANQDQENVKMVTIVLVRWSKLNNANHVTVQNGLIGPNFLRVAQPAVVVKESKAVRVLVVIHV